MKDYSGMENIVPGIIYRKRHLAGGRYRNMADDIMDLQPKSIIWHGRINRQSTDIMKMALADSKVGGTAEA